MVISMKVTIVHVHPEGDGVTGLYINDELYRDGDEYHDKIGKWVEGFLEGLKRAGAPFVVDTLYVTDESCPDGDLKYDLQMDIPEQLSDYP